MSNIPKKSPSNLDLIARGLPTDRLGLLSAGIELPLASRTIENSVMKLLEQENLHERLMDTQKGLSELIQRSIGPLPPLPYMDVDPAIYATLQRTLAAYEGMSVGLATALDGRMQPDLVSGLGGLVDAFRRPELAEGLNLISRAVVCTDATDLNLLAAQTALAKTLESLSSPWARIGGELQSAKALSQLGTLARSITELPPYLNETTHIARDMLGDWRKADLPSDNIILDVFDRSRFYRDVGFNEGLTDFPGQSFEEASYALGLYLPDPDGDQDSDAALAERIFSDIRRIERALRKFIKTQLEQHVGENWIKQRIPGPMRLSWEGRRETDIAKGLQPRPHLIDYADFNDYLQIIQQRNNWDQVFKVTFHRPENISESLQRIAPVRIVTMHSSILTLDDSLLVKFEGRRIFEAINRART